MTHIRGVPAGAERHHKFAMQMGRKPFGIYRALTNAAVQPLGVVLLGAKQDMDQRIRWKQGTRFTLPDDFGVTLASRSVLERTIQGSPQQKELQWARFYRSVSRVLIPRDGTALQVSIEGLDWYGAGDRKLVAKLAPSAGGAELLKQSRVIAGLLNAVVGTELDVLYDPDHVTLLRFGGPEDFSTELGCRRNRLSGRERTDLEDMMLGHLAKASVSSLEVSGVTVGDGYAQ